MSKKFTPPDRIRGFTSLADYQSGTAEGRVATTDFHGHTLRRIWHEGEWWHSVVDVVGALTESANPGTYWRVLKKRLKDEGSAEAVTNCNALKLPTEGGSQKSDCATTENLFRIIQSVPSKRAEPIKQFLAKVGAERLEETAEPSRMVDRAIQAYRDKGRDDEWIDGRLQNISARNELTDEWKQRGADGPKAAPITQEMHKEMLGHTPSDHARLKRLGSQELRDHCDGLELAIVTLGERAAKTIIVERDTTNFHETKAASIDGAKIAGDARKKIEEAIGRSVANKSNFLTAEQQAIADQEERQIEADREAKELERLAKKEAKEAEKLAKKEARAAAKLAKRNSKGS